MRSILLSFLCTYSFLFAEPQAVYLTLPEDSAHSMSIHWIEKKQKRPVDTLFYQKEGDTNWKKIASASHQMLGGSSYSVKECLIEGLEEASYYSFYFEGEKEKHLFRTLPTQLTAPLKIAIGGDFTESFRLYRKMNQVASQKNPDFVVLGGDIAYASGHGFFSGKHGSVTRWIDFFQEWQKTMRGERGRLIPVVAVVGNHDITSTDRKEEGLNALFFRFFPSKQSRSYKTLDVAGALCLFLLDSGHLFPIPKEQTLWLEENLRKKESMLWKIPVYHLAGYPSTYSPKFKLPSQVRKHWTPLFERYGVKLAFEHHNHGFKRTYPLWEEKIHPLGIVYMGDGCWGAPPRKGIQPQFYLEKSISSSYFSLLTVDQKSLKVEVFNEKAKLIDEWESKIF